MAEKDLKFQYMDSRVMSEMFNTYTKQHQTLKPNGRRSFDVNSGTHHHQTLKSENPDSWPRSGLKSCLKSESNPNQNHGLKYQDQSISIRSSNSEIQERSSELTADRQQ